MLIRRVAVLTGILLVSISLAQGQMPAPSDQTGDGIARPLRIGGGGWVVGLDSTNGQLLARTDTYGAYLWNASTQTWSQLITQASMPAEHFGYYPPTGTAQVGRNAGGTYEIAACPANEAVIYMMYGDNIFVSTNRGAKWTATGYRGGSVGNPNGGFRADGRKMAVDPTNCDKVLAGTDQNGLWTTTSGTAGTAATWSRVDSAPIPTATASAKPCNGRICYPGYAIAFDPATSAAGMTSRVYVHAYGYADGVERGGLNVSNDGGLTWSRLSGSPPYVAHMVVARNGVVWVADNTRVLRFDGRVWKTPLTSGGWHAVAVDPADPNHVVAQTESGALAVSMNGETFTRLGRFSRVADDVPWLGVTAESFMSSGDIAFDSNGSNLLIFAQGIGVWKTNPPPSGDFTWTSMTAGIEQLVAQQIIAPNGVPIVGVQDRATLTVPGPHDTYSAYQSNPNRNSASILNQTYSLDWAADDKKFVVAQVGDYIRGNSNFSGYSTDGGLSFKVFSSWYHDVPASSVSRYSGPFGNNLVQIAVPSTSGLTTWQEGRGAIVRTVRYDSNGNAPIPNQYWYVGIVDDTHLVLLDSKFAASYTNAGRYLVYVDTNPLGDRNGLGNITAMNSDRGATQVTIAAKRWAINLVENMPVCVTGVVGTGDANGCWLIGSPDATAGVFTLKRSSFGSYHRGGVASFILPAGGYMASASRKNIVHVPANGEYPYCSSDGGLTWRQMRAPAGLTTGDAVGWTFPHWYWTQHNIAADRVIPETIYLYNSGAPRTGDARAGLYITTNCGPLTQVLQKFMGAGNSVLRSVPDKAGHLFFTAGPQGSAKHPTNSPLFRSVDGGRSVETIPGAKEIITMDFGAYAPGADYPTMYMIGWVNESFGVWRSLNAGAARSSFRGMISGTTLTVESVASGSIALGQQLFLNGVSEGTIVTGFGTGSGDTGTYLVSQRQFIPSGTMAAGPTFERVTNYMLGSMDGHNSIAADGVEWSKWYVGFSGSGYAWGQKQ
uniref:Uncharacterized protein n=1 Tax=Rhodopseudomonas palustris (strain BisA53) TaxID=316055 RepID=Q07SM3_RHOP5